MKRIKDKINKGIVAKLKNEIAQQRNETAWLKFKVNMKISDFNLAAICCMTQCHVRVPVSV